MDIERESVSTLTNTHMYKSLNVESSHILGNSFFIFPRFTVNPCYMDRQGGFIVPKCFRFMILIVVSLSFFLYSYFSGFPFFFFFSYNLELSSLVFPLFARALDRKYMFLVCNGIVVFLAKTGILKSAEAGVEQITELPAVVIKEGPVRENAASMDYAIKPSHMAVAEEQTMQHPEQDNGEIDKGAEETKMDDIILETKELEGEEEEEDDDDDDDNYLQENKNMDSLSQVGEVNEARMSTEELNRKIEEFIRKMKEEISIEAQQQLITV